MLIPSEVERLSAMSIWAHFDDIVRTGSATIDRPRGCAHPKVPEYIYPLDYGYIDNTDGGDGSGIDIWLGSADSRTATALFCTFDPLKRNAELKVAWNCTEEEISVIEAFYAPQPQAVLTVRRPKNTSPQT